MKNNKKVEDENIENNVVIQCDKPVLPEFFESKEDILHWLTELGKVGFSEEKVMSIIRQRMSFPDYKSTSVSLLIPNTAEFIAYNSGKDSADFELMYSLQSRACSVDKYANDAAETLLKLNTSNKLKDEIKKRFMK